MLTTDYVCSVAGAASLLSANPAHLDLTAAEVAVELVDFVLSSETVTSIIQVCAESAAEVIGATLAVVQQYNTSCPGDAFLVSGAALTRMQNIIETAEAGLQLVSVKYSTNLPPGSGPKLVSSSHSAGATP